MPTICCVGARLGARPPLPADGIERTAAARRDSLDPSRGGLYPLHVGLDRHAERRRAERSGAPPPSSHGRRRNSALAPDDVVAAGRLGHVRPLGVRPVRARRAPAPARADPREHDDLAGHLLPRHGQGRGDGGLLRAEPRAPRDRRSQALGWAELGGSRLRHIVFAGEPIDKPALRRFRPLLPAVRDPQLVRADRDQCLRLPSHDRRRPRRGRADPDRHAVPLCALRLSPGMRAAGDGPRPASCWSPATRCSPATGTGRGGDRSARCIATRTATRLLPHRRLRPTSTRAAISSSSAGATGR